MAFGLSRMHQFTAISMVCLWSLSSFGFTLPKRDYHVIDLAGRIVVTWDIVNWTSDEYIAIVSMRNLQKYRPVSSPGWRMSWVWRRGEIIKSIRGAQIANTSDCSKPSKVRFGYGYKYCKEITIMDLMPNASHELRFPNCCKGGVLLSSSGQDPANSMASFEMVVRGGQRSDEKMTLGATGLWIQAPAGYGYACGRLNVVAGSRYQTSCGHARYMALESPRWCCMSFSAFDNVMFVPCPRFTCGCPDNTTCQNFSKPLAHTDSLVAAQVQRTSHMCPIHIHWHLSRNHENKWQVRVTIENLSHKIEYNGWNLIVQHPRHVDFEAAKVTGYNHKLVTDELVRRLMVHEGGSGDYIPDNSRLIGKVEFDIIYPGRNSPQRAWAPRAVLFSGEHCEMPDPDAISSLLDDISRQESLKLILRIVICVNVILVFAVLKFFRVI